MSQNGPFPGSGNPDPQQPPQPPGGFGNQYPAPGGPQWGGQPGYPQQGWQQQPPPQPGQGWAQQPPPPPGYGPGPQPPYGGQQPWGAPPPSQPPTGRSNKVVLGAVGGVLGLALIGGGIWAFRNNTGSATPSVQPTVIATQGSTQPSQPTQSSLPTVAAPKASDAVVTYLRALGAGDALTALALAASSPSGDTAFLTNGVLAKATAGRITDITVAEVTDPNATQVAASYTLAGKPVTASFPVTRVGDQFRLTRVTALVDLSRLQKPLAPVSLAGVAAKSSVVQLFPGVYPVTATNKHFSYGSAKVTVTDLDDRAAGTATLSVSSSGKSAIVKAVKAKYAWCLKQNSLRPTGCAIWFRQPSGVKFRTSTISYRTTSGAKWSSAKLKYIGNGMVEGVARTKVRFDVRATNGRRWYGTAPITGFRAMIGSSKVTATFY